MPAHVHTLPVFCTPSPHGARLAVPLPDGAAGQWCALSLRLACAGPWWAKLELTDEARGQVVRDVFLGPMQRHGAATERRTLVHVPGEARALNVELFGTGGAGAALRLTVLPRVTAAALLAWRGARVLPRALRGSPMGALGRVRAMIGQAPARAGEAPPYSTWIALFEHHPDATAPDWDGEVAIAGGPPALIAASRASASSQAPRPVPARVVAGQAGWAGGEAEWIVILAAGEILAPGACAAFARAALAYPWAEVLSADCDRLDAHGARCDPLFKPGPDTLLIGTGLYPQGALAVRSRNVSSALSPNARAARGEVLRASAGRIAHVPGILSHVPHGIDQDSDVAHVPARVPNLSVTMLVPSAARSSHVARCLRRVVLGTDYADFTLRLVLSDTRRARASVRAKVARLPRVTILPVEISPFNYARVNNEAAENCACDLLLLLNDDVAPINRDWLCAMVAHMNDPRVGIVGARLLYGNGLVQHEGVIMGLANLCEHAGRLADPRDAGPYGIGGLDREVSAVTGACMLIRASLYRALGGMDEAFCVALNDVDLCLRARAAGWRVVYCAGAVLHHYESLSLGRHYGGGRAGLERVEVARLRGRFPGQIAADPFYNPLASLQPGREWQPAFPPRAKAGCNEAIPPGPPGTTAASG